MQLMMLVESVTWTTKEMKSDNKLTRTFWEAFLNVREEIEHFMLTAPIKALRLVEDRLRQIDTGLRCELGPGKKNEWMIAISPSGKEWLLPLIRQIVTDAPTIKGWEIIEGKPKKRHIQTIQMLSPSGQWEEFSIANTGFVAYSWNNTNLLEIYLVSETAPDDEVYAYNVAYTLLDTILGEIGVMTRIAHVEFIRETPAAGTLVRPLNTLEDFLDTYYSETN